MSDNSNPILYEIYRVAGEIIRVADNVTWRIRIGKPAYGDAVVEDLGRLEGQIHRLLLMLGDGSDAVSVYTTEANSSLERQINASRQHKAVGERSQYPNALRAVVGIGERVTLAVASTIKPGVTSLVGCDALFLHGERPADSFTNIAAWQECYRQKFACLRCNEGWNQHEWQAFCERCTAELPSFNLQTIVTALALEKAAAEQAGLEQNAARHGSPTNVKLAGADADGANAGEGTGKAKKSRGRKPYSEIDQKADKRLCADWKAAKREGATRETFARDKGISVNDLIAAMDRERYRERRDAE